MDLCCSIDIFIALLQYRIHIKSASGKARLVIWHFSGGILCARFIFKTCYQIWKKERKRTHAQLILISINTHLRHHKRIKKYQVLPAHVTHNTYPLPCTVEY